MVKQSEPDRESDASIVVRLVIAMTTLGQRHFSCDMSVDTSLEAGNPLLEVIFSMDKLGSNMEPSAECTQGENHWSPLLNQMSYPGL